MTSSEVARRVMDADPVSYNELLTQALDAEHKAINTYQVKPTNHNLKSLDGI